MGAMSWSVGASMALLGVALIFLPKVSESRYHNNSGVLGDAI